ncbi:MAG: SEC-C metal-binding domain-containing protein, partial [Sulfurifustaceae bacterium]
REAFELFSDMLARIKQEVVTLLARLQIEAEAPQSFTPPPRVPQELHFLHPSASSPAPSENGEVAEEAEVAVAPRPVVRKQPKVGRNQPCPCGSGKKYKHCHGRLE